MVSIRPLRAVLLLAGLSVAPVPASAQTGDKLSELLLRFFSPRNPVVLQDNVNPAFSHAAHFVSQPNAQQTLTQLNRGIASQLSTFPLGSSSAGFTFEFDPALGVFNRSTESFGPVFAERPITAGKGKFSFGVTYLRATYDRFEGQELRENDIQLYLTHLDTNADNSVLEPWFEGDIIRADLSMDLQNETTVFFANYGLGEKLDVGIAVPYQRLDLDARIHTTIERLATGVDPFVIHVFDDGQAGRTYREAGTASGVGDIVLRAKYNAVKGSTVGLALATDLRLPTGDEEDLLGSGGTQAKLYAILSAGHSRRFAPRASVGYTFSSGGADFLGELPDEINYTAGFDAALHSRVSLTADFLGRTLRDAERLVERERTFRNRTRLSPAVTTITRVTPVVERGNLNVFLGSAGIKINPVGRLLLVGNVLFALGDSGLQDKVTPVFGIDYSF